MYNPVSTYRIQFHKGFTFHHFEKIIPYLQKLGVGAIYASPVFSAVPGSMHGYDGVNPLCINPEIGTEDQLREICKKLDEAGIGWIQDIVPNHMAFSPDNEWLADVLEKGKQSRWYNYFDIIENPKLDNRLMVPFLGAPLEEAIGKGDIKIAFKNGRFGIQYFDFVYPIKPASYTRILEGENTPDEVKQFVEAVKSGGNDNLRDWLNSLMNNESARGYIENRVAAINASEKDIIKISGEQEYRLCHWEETNTRINYRRFFTVNSLICLNIQNGEAFNHYHSYIKKLTDEGLFKGLRIDHIDGLYDPTVYLERLRELVGDSVYIVVEKILQLNENLPGYWPIQGTTGYDYLGFVNNLFTNKKNEKKFSRYYAKLAGEKALVKDELHDKKAFILNKYMGGELENLYRLFIGLNITDSVFSVEQTEIKSALAEFLVQCPVYCYYSNNFPLNKTESEAIQQIINRAHTAKPELRKAIDLLEYALLKKPLEGRDEYNRKAAHFYLRLMQFTGPLMAKGMEDTLMYTYNRFIDHNEVGDSPEAFGIYPELFHRKMLARQQNWPFTMNSTSTHDTKRGEGVRARLNVLTDMADEWFDHVEKWQKLNVGLKKNDIPDSNDEYLIYQVLMGAYPMPGESGIEFLIRLEKYIEKALREAKTHSDWTAPNKEYEDNTRRFILKITDKKHEFLADFLKFHEKVAGFGIINSLCQLVLKLTCPGVPDTYQGTELWDLSLVDPDNRRPVDYTLREKHLIGILEHTNGKLPQYLWEHRYDGRIKLWLLHTLLQERKNKPEIFSSGFYHPLEIKGKYKDHLIAYALRYQMQWYVIAIPLHLAELTTTATGWMAFDWHDTRVLVPGEAPESWTSVLTGTEVNGGELPASTLFKELPFAVVKAEYPENKRSAGVLLHITSLPSAFGIGDLGFEARDFANFLGRSCQKYWQLLPLNPTSEEAGHSPYSSISSMAGNPLLVSPGWLVDIGLLDKSGIQKHIMPAWNKAAYGEARNHKNELFEMAYTRFKSGSFKKLEKEFSRFCESEAYWLDDFALFVVIRRQQGGKPWYQWPSELKKRDYGALKSVTSSKAAELERVKWLQFIFSKQWHELKTYCSRLGIRLFGDMPIYMSYDSADVWAHPDIFSLDENRNINGVAGVPPDYFSETGQLWGMPTFRWDVLKQQGYQWWIDRLKKNLELFDLVRIDHFRAFNDYWEVSPDEETAINGQWLPGPGIEFFRSVEKALGKLPIIAEDLGYEMGNVYRLRDEAGLSGMKVLQFAFGDNLPVSVDIPHNYTPKCVVYTGTHDNDTTVGWFGEGRKDEMERLEKYSGMKVNSKNIHIILGKIAYASVAEIAVLPLQDVLGLDATARMNTPGTPTGNWLWRFIHGQITPDHEKLLRDWARFYNRV